MKNMLKYKIAALIGIILMGCGSFMTCLSTSASVVMAGNVLLVISMVITIYAFNVWQP